MLKKIAQWFSSKDELIGVWTNYDDGSGLINIFGWSLHFLENGKGKSYYWESNSESSYDFEWQREDKKKIKIRTKKEDDWETITYATKVIHGAYGTKKTELTEIDERKFWSSHEPLYK